MTETVPPSAATPDSIADAVARALAAAAAATDAAHEAEAVLLARAETTKAIERAAQRTGWLTMAAAAAAVAVVGLGGIIWLRSAADLRVAAEVQSAAATGFIERLAEMNVTLDRFQTLLDQAEGAAVAREDRLNAMLTTLDGIATQLAEQQAAQSAANAERSSAPEGAPDLDTLRADILAAIAESEMSMAERLSNMTPPAAVAAAPAAAQKLVPRPVPRAATPSARPPAVNPFRFP